MSSVDLRVGGVVYSGWTDVHVTKSLEQLAHSFKVQVTDRWADDTKAGAPLEPVPIQAGSTVRVDSDSERLITGYVVSDQSSYDATSRRINIAGVSKTGDLVDCTAQYRSGAWRNESLLTIAKNLCDPFDIDVSANVDLGDRLRRFSIEEGESVFTCLSRAARRRSALLLSDSDGNLVFDRAAETRIRTVLDYGVNILSGSRSDSWARRYSDYTVKVQTSGTDESHGKATTLKRSVSDTTIDRHRPIVILGDNESNGTELSKRVTWERNTRSGRDRRYNYTVQGWRHANGFWEPNTLVRVADARFRIDETLLIVSCTFSKNSSGTTTILELSAPEAFSLES